MTDTLPRQSTDHVLMIEPSRFFSNPATRDDNRFQSAAGHGFDEVVHRAAAAEFAALRDLLRSLGVTVITYREPEDAGTPDALFPNNWISTHEDGRVVLYPMKAPSRRGERRPDVVAGLSDTHPITIDLTASEAEHEFLEGTGSLVLDRRRRVAYACRSPRTSERLTAQWCESFGYEGVVFDAVSPDGTPVYHTNVILSVGTGYAVACLEAVPEGDEKRRLRTFLEGDDACVVEVSQQQVAAFCANALEIRRGDGTPSLVMSSGAYASFSSDQLEIFDRLAPPVHVPLPTIESHGGGGARCMIAEIFLPR